MSDARSDRDIIRSVEDKHGERCVDFISRADCSIVFKVYRKDPEDYGRWSLIADYSAVSYSSPESAYKAACERVSWLDEES
ncbi:MAG: hypothetical protein ACKVP7_20655 [Hyphomicrobiaceae bacterium]